MGMGQNNSKKHNLQEEIEKRILYGLSLEWDKSLWVLDAAYRFQLKKPLFSIRDMKTRLGTWDSDKREICLSRDFVINYPWGAVCEVLKHEIAHQFTNEVFKVKNGGHSCGFFKKACYLLRADPKSSGSYVPLGGKGQIRKTDDKDTIMIRVKKLLALAESQNQHEAEAAMKKAHELIYKYNVDLISEKGERDFISIFLGNPSLRHFREEYHLAGLLTEYYFVEGIWISAFVVGKGKMGRVLEISGTAKNIEIAGYVYDFINRYIDRSWQTYNKNKRLNRYRKTDFSVGIIEGFKSKLEHRSPSPDHYTAALVRVEDPLLKDYFSYRYPQTSSFRRTVSSQDDSVLDAGKQLGKKMVISKGVTEKSAKNVRLIGT